MNLEDLEIYKIAQKISDIAWDVYEEIPQEFKFKTGQQFLTAADSIGANISEGYGRYHYKDSLRFYYIARGSLIETDWWTSRLIKRNLIDNKHKEEMLALITTERIKLNKFIASTASK